MKNNPILIVEGQPNSVFFEIFFKTIKMNNFSSPLILIASNQILKTQLKKFKSKKTIRLLSFKNLKGQKLDNKKINLINIDYKCEKKINSQYSKIYIKKCFEMAFKILKTGFTKKFINGPINKNEFLDRKFLGMTEYISRRFNNKNYGMLIYNEKLSVCPITTHLPLKLVSKKITKKLINEKVLLINDFYKKTIGFVPKIGVTGLNPHCESIHRFNEDNKIISPAIKILKKSGIKVFGPFAADTIFLKKNREKYNVILGMYHDQVLTPIKTLFEYDAINITMGLPFIRISPDHGPNEKMIGKNLSNPKSLIKALKFLDKK
jgi:4-hydroxy-L-threonine phosphate dehydrogenase PdxA